MTYGISTENPDDGREARGCAGALIDYRDVFLWTRPDGCQTAVVQVTEFVDTGATSRQVRADILRGSVDGFGRRSNVTLDPEALLVQPARP